MAYLSIDETDAVAVHGHGVMLSVPSVKPLGFVSIEQITVQGECNPPPIGAPVRAVMTVDDVAVAESETITYKGIGLNVFRFHVGPNGWPARRVGLRYECLTDKGWLTVPFLASDQWPSDRVIDYQGDTV